MSMRLLVGVAVFVSACRSGPPEQGQAPVDPAPAVTDTGKALPKPEEIVYVLDADGALLPSDEFVAGLRLPRGLELYLDRPNFHLYRTRTPVYKVLAYFGPMLITGKVERQGAGAVYRQASVRGAEINPTKVDVSVTDVGEGYTRVAITELPPPPAHPPEKEEVLRRAQRDFKRLD